MPPPGHRLAPAYNAAQKDIYKFVSDMESLRELCQIRPSDWLMKEWSYIYAGATKGKEWQQLPEATEEYTWGEYKEALYRRQKSVVTLNVSLSADFEIVPPTEPGTFGAQEVKADMRKALQETLGKMLSQLVTRYGNGGGETEEKGRATEATEPIPPVAVMPTSGEAGRSDGEGTLLGVKARSARACWYCKQEHEGRPCHRLQSYLIAGKVVQKPDGKITLPSGRFIPRDIKGDCYLDRVDEFYSEMQALGKAQARQAGTSGGRSTEPTEEV